MKKQNKLGTYLAVTVGAGCASSVASGAIQVVDLSGLLESIQNGKAITFPTSTGDGSVDITVPNSLSIGGIVDSGSYASFYSDALGFREDPTRARGYTVGPAAFPSDPDGTLLWLINGVTGGGVQLGDNWVAFKDTADNYGWVNFTLDNLGPTASDPVSSFNFFVYDDSSTSPANAIALETAIAATSVPEPSSLALLALGATGLVTRRNRKKAA